VVQLELGLGIDFSVSYVSVMGLMECLGDLVLHNSVGVCGLSIYQSL